MFGNQPEMPESITRTTGFIRFLRDECGLQFVMHYVGFSLRSFMSEVWSDDPRLADETYFQDSMEYLVDVITDFEHAQELTETLQRQADEITWLTEEVVLKRQELALEHDNLRLMEELQTLQDDYVIEKMEHDYLIQIIEPIF
jgi:hypothetical protein